MEATKDPRMLHERLKDCNECDSPFPFTLCEGVRVMISGQGAHKLADEIERYYIPRPRFEDGEPVPWRSQGIQWNDTDDYNPQAPWYMTAISSNGEPLATTSDAIVSRAEMSDDGFVKRLQPKVLDADGMEIKVGDTVWSKLGNAWTVDSVASDLDVYVIDRDGISSCFTAGYLTHKEPDSLDKLLDDMTKFGINTYFASLEVREPFEGFISRLSALIERSA